MHPPLFRFHLRKEFVVQTDSGKAQMRERADVLYHILSPVLPYVCERQAELKFERAVLAQKTADATLFLLLSVGWRQVPTDSQLLCTHLEFAEAWKRYSYENILISLQLAVNKALDGSVDVISRESGHSKVVIRPRLLAVHEVLNALVAQELRASASW